MRNSTIEDAARRVLERAAKNGTVDYHDRCMQELEYALQDHDEMPKWINGIMVAIPLVVLFLVGVLLTIME